MIGFLIAIVAFFGLVMGFFINIYVREELEQGEKYFLMLKRILILVLIVVFLYNSYERYIAILSGLIAGYFFKREYLYLGVGLAAGGFYPLRELVAGLIFLYGLVYSAVNYKDIKARNIFLNLIYFTVPFLVLFILFDFLTMLDLMAFAAGALFWRFK